MDEKTLDKLLHEPKEKDWFDFKSTLRLYQSDGKLAEKQRDELLKDILGLANGNTHIIRKTKYLIIGADNEKFDEDGRRLLYNGDYRVPEQSEIVKWLSSASSPAIVGLESELMSFQDVNLWVITIPPTFDLHETTRELNASARFQKHVVIMRQDEHTMPASLRDAISIQHLKYLYRQEISNPSAIWIGAIVGAVVAFIIGGAKIKAVQIDLASSAWFLQFIFVVLGIFFGASTGFFAKQFNETRYDWHYWTKQQRIIAVIIAVVAIVVVYFISR